MKTDVLQKARNAAADYLVKYVAWSENEAQKVRNGHRDNLATVQAFISFAKDVVEDKDEPKHIDPETGRPVGDHGTGEQAIDWVLNHSGDSDLYNMEAFLKCWNEGSAYEEWPEYYVWLKTQDV